MELCVICGLKIVKKNSHVSFIWIFEPKIKNKKWCSGKNLPSNQRSKVEIIFSPQIKMNGKKN